MDLFMSVLGVVLFLLMGFDFVETIKQNNLLKEQNAILQRIIRNSKEAKNGRRVKRDCQNIWRSEPNRDGNRGNE